MPYQVQTQQLKFAGGALTATTNISTEAVRMYGERLSVQANLTGTGAVSVTANVEGSNDNVTFALISALSLSGTGSDSELYVVTGPVGYVRVTLASITGTAATVAVNIAGVP